MKIKKVIRFFLPGILLILANACNTPAVLEGTWSGYEIGSSHRDWTLTIEHNQFALICENGSMWFKGNLRLNTNCNRKKMDLLISDSPIQIYNGKTAFGIYEIEDDSLILVTAEPGNRHRPFSLQETVGVLAFVFEKGN